MTVITITRRRPCLLWRALLSVQGQRYTGVIQHLVIIDDCEESVRLLSSFDAQTVNVSWVSLQRTSCERYSPAHLSKLRNYAVRIAQYDHIAFLDDDNVFEPNHLCTLAQIAEKTRSPAVHSQRRLYYRDGRPYLERRYPWSRDEATGRTRYQELLRKGVFEVGSNIMRDRVDPKGTTDPVLSVDTSEWFLDRDLLLNIPFPEKYSLIDRANRVAEDKKLLKALVKEGISLSSTNLPTLNYYLGGYSNSFNSSESEDQ